MVAVSPNSLSFSYQYQLKTVSIYDALTAYGLTLSESQIFTPLVACRDYLLHQSSGKTALFIPEASKQDMSGLDIYQPGQDDPASVTHLVVGDMGEGWDYGVLNGMLRLLLMPSRPQIVALGMTRYWRAEDGLRMDVGAFVSALQYASSCHVEVVGKPGLAFFQQAAAKLDGEPSRLCMVGDDIQSDIGGAQAAGIDGILVRTGKFQPADLESDVEPKWLLDSIADLPELWQSW